MITFRLSQVLARCRAAQLLLCLLPATLCGCDAGPKAAVPSSRRTKPQAAARADCTSYAPDQFGGRVGDDDIEYKGESFLSWRGYEVAKRVRKVRAGSSEYEADIEYAVLMKNHRVVATFDGDPGWRSEIRFALSPLLSGGSRQLVVEQTSNRFWRYWVVSLSPDFEVIYDSDEYGMIYELKTADPDGDGVRELVQSLGAFWFFSLPENARATLNNINSTRPEIIFRYDPARRKYVPANREFQALMLEDLAARAERARGLSGAGPCFPAVLDVLLRYVYAGREDEGWAFFEAEYHAPDKDEVRAEVKKTLGRDPVRAATYDAAPRRRGADETLTP